MSSFYDRMQHIDRRIIYLVLATVLIASLIVSKPETPVVLPPVQSLFDAVEQAPAGPGDGKIITVGTTFGASTLGENGNQARALFRHMMLRKKRFVVFAIGEPQGAVLGPRIVNELAEQYGYEYGKDWISLGYQLNSVVVYKALLKDIPGTMKEDSIERKSLASFPIMQGIKSIQNDVALHLEISASDSVSNWLQFVQPSTQPRLKIGYACTGVMAAEAYPLLDSGQLSGMTPGLKGAADYELLVDNLEAEMVARGEREELSGARAKGSLPGMGQSARQYMFTQNNAHLVVLLFILVGNIGLLLARRKRSSTVKEEESNG